MAFPLTRPPSREGHISAQSHDDDNLSSALQTALSSFVPGLSSHQDHHHDMGKERAGIDIVVDSDCLFLKGTSVDVEPVLLKGHIVLRLTEPTSIKEITLLFKGKAKLPSPSADALSLGTSPQWYTFCHHEWSFLEGEKRHSRTLKAGYHQFPFQLQLGGSLPSSLASSIYGGAHLSYKLRAVAVRPGLAHNMQAVMPISIVRTFAPEALEYQQSLEIENTWPDKLMYSIMIPHKAWAAGDELTAIVKFAPLSKGVRVLSVATTIQEITKVHHCRGGVQEQSRVVVTANHEIHNGNVAAPIREQQGSVQPLSSVVGLSHEDHSQSFGSLGAFVNQDLTLRQVPSTASSSSSHDSRPLPVPPLRDNGPLTVPREPVASTSTSTTSTSTAEQDIPLSRDDVVARLTVFIPKFVTPSHSLEPITVNHRIRWSIFMSNLDGHTSELRCSLPLHVLDARLIDEARANSAATRRLLLGAPEAPVNEEQDAELPSYSAHVRDRVANMYFPDSATTRVPNPWVHPSMSPSSEHPTLSDSWSPTGAASPLQPHPVSSQLPHIPQSGTNTPLDWVNSELLLSLSNAPSTLPHTDTSSHSSSDPVSRPESRLVSRRGSRAPSPERNLTMTALSPAQVSATTHATFLHDGHASRTLPGLFSIQLKPYSPLTSPSWLSSRPNSHTNLVGLVDTGQTRLSARSLSTLTAPVPLSVSVPVGGYAQPSTTSSPSTAENSENAMWHRAFVEVPDYDVASRGFIGGVTPLTSMRGLPSYEEAERSGGAEDALTIRRRVPRREQG